MTGPMTADTGDGPPGRSCWAMRQPSRETVILLPTSRMSSPILTAAKAGRLRCFPQMTSRTCYLRPGLMIDPRGLQIRGAIVVGTLNLNYASVPWPPGVHSLPI